MDVPEVSFPPCWSECRTRPCLWGTPGGVTQWVSGSPPTPDPDLVAHPLLTLTPRCALPGPGPRGPCGPLPRVGPSLCRVFVALLSPFSSPGWCFLCGKLVSAGRHPPPPHLLALWPLQTWRPPGPLGDTSSRGSPGLGWGLLPSHSWGRGLPCHRISRGAFPQPCSRTQGARGRV